MSFQIRLYTFSKRNNSTKRPSGDGTLFNCTIKSDSGILNPLIELDIGTSSNPSQYNYAYIPAYDRYYWIEEWTNRGLLWLAIMRVDSLATWKNTIGASSLYVLRASAQYDGNVVDTFYPTKTNPSTSYVGFTTPFLPSGSQAPDIYEGSFIIGVNEDNATYGSVSYFACSKASISALCSQLMGNGLVNNTNFLESDASIALQKALIDPLSYIKSCMWIPIPLADIAGSARTSLSLLGFTITGLNIKEITGNPFRSYTRLVTIAKHPQTATRGNFVNTAPYTLNSLFFAPFGLIELDSSLLANDTSIRCEIMIDYISGAGTLKLQYGGILVNRMTAQVGVPIQLSQVTQDVLSARQSTTVGLFETMGKALTLNVFGALSSDANAVADATRALAPRTSSIGGSGGFSDLHGQPYVYQQFFPFVDDDLSHNGRPLCQIKTPASLGGYMLIQDGDVSISGTSTEAEEIRSFLESGFYYE